jgi:hypothetical protein
MLNLLRNTISNFRVSQATEDANNFLAAAGITGQVQSQAIYNLVNDLQASGLWSKMKAVYPMVTDNKNVLSYTEDFANAFWNKFNSSVSSNVTTSPIGTLTADSFNDGTSNAQHQVYGQINSLPIGTYTFSFYLKSNTNTKNIAFYPFGTATPGGTGTGGVILTQNGTFVANIGGGVVSYGSQDVGNGWRRFYVVGTSTAISNVYPVISYADGTNVIYTGTNTDCYIWGAQFELASSASTYQPILTTPSAFMASQMKYNLKDARDLDAAFRLTWSGGWTYSATGATPNGTNAYADTKLSPFNNLSQNSFHSSAYLRTPLSTAQTGFGVIKSDYTERTDIINYTGTLYSSVGTSATQVGTSVTPYQSLILGSRLNSTSNSLYVGGVLRANSIVSNSANLPSNNYYLGTVNQNMGFYNNNQIAFSTIGNGLNDQEAQLLNQIVEKYQVALSRGVQAAQSFYYNSAYSNESNTYLYSTQITGTTQVSAINTLINGLKANNLWTKMKAVYPFVTDKTLQADMAAQMKFNLVNPQDTDAAFRLAFSGGWTYSTNGAQPNGTNGYADTKLPASLFATNNAHLSFYSRTNNNITTSREIGVNNTSSFNPEYSILMKDVGGGGGILGDFNNIILTTVTNSDYYSVVSRLSATDFSFYKNGVFQASNTTNNTITATTLSIYIGASNFGGTPARYSSRQAALATIGDGLTSAEITILNQLIQQFQTTLSRNV